MIAVGLTLLPTAVADAQGVPEPDDDPFYAVPAGIADLPNGEILDSRAITATALGAPLPAHAWQVKYKTLDNQDQPTATVTTVMVPLAAWAGEGPRPLLSYQTAEDGVGTKCAPSFALRAGLQAASSNPAHETPFIALALLRGWTVAAPDYEGPRSQFLGARMEARGALDGIRAARAFKPAAIAGDAPYGMVGYSGGSFATAWAAQLQSDHAPELRLAGIALGGLVADVKASIRGFDGGKPLGGAIALAFVGLDRAYPEANVLSYFNDLGREKIAASQRDCINDAVVRHPFLSMAQIEARPNVLDEPESTAFLARISPLGFPGTPATPVYDYHNVQDQEAPIGPDRQLIARWCAAGVPVQHVEHSLGAQLSIGNHLAELPIGYPGALDYLADRFAGKPVPSNCSHGSAAKEPAGTTFALRVRPATVRRGKRTSFAFLARQRTNRKARRLAGATIRFAGRHTRTTRAGRATITATLRRTPRRERARLIAGGRTVATATVRVR